MEIEELVNVIKKLRSPEGCPWDRKQTPESLISAFLEEVYELVDAIYEKDDEKIKEELGDVLLHVVFQSVFAEERGKFTIKDVIKEIVDKIIRRHPHVFGTKKRDWSIEEINLNWEKIKSEEKNKKERGLFDGIPKTLPALFYAYKITKKAEKVGFDWKSVDSAIEKLKEEMNEFTEAVLKKEKKEIEEELGDVLFMVVNVARKMRINPEEALMKANRKFLRRFKFIENSLKDQKLSFEDVDIDYMENLWNKAKKLEKAVEK